jgi:mono/diheme cytochrome c family protein
VKAKAFQLGGVLAAAVFSVLLLAGCEVHTEQPYNAEELIEWGHVQYVEYCAECHQVDGMGWSSLYPRLAGNPIVTLHDAEPLIVTVTYGQGSMPAFGNRIPPENIAAILSYIRNAWGNEAAPISPRQIH